jgi:hypothetical protein
VVVRPASNSPERAERSLLALFNPKATLGDGAS